MRANEVLHTCIVRCEVRSHMASRTQLGTGFDRAVWLVERDKKKVHPRVQIRSGWSRSPSNPVCDSRCEQPRDGEPVTKLEAPLMEFTVQYIRPVRNPSTTKIGCYSQQFKPASAGIKSCPPECAEMWDGWNAKRRMLSLAEIRGQTRGRGSVGKPVSEGGCKAGV